MRTASSNLLGSLEEHDHGQRLESCRVSPPLSPSCCVVWKPCLVWHFNLLITKNNLTKINLVSNK